MARGSNGQSAEISCRINNLRKPVIIYPVIDELGILPGLNEARIAKDR